jgi:hypothetical protein
VQLCVQRRLACLAGESPAGVGARSPVAWITGRRETKALKLIDKAITRMAASQRAVTQVNAQVAPKVRSPGGRVCNRRMKAAWDAAVWLKRCATPAG